MCMIIDFSLIFYAVYKNMTTLGNGQLHSLNSQDYRKIKKDFINLYPPSSRYDSSDIK